MIDKSALMDAAQPPAEPGWYPTVVCYDANEGAFPAAHLWDGQQWQDSRGLFQYWPERKASQNEALAFARDNDFGW